MASPLILVLCFVAGWLLRQTGKLPEGSHSKVNKFIIWLPLPCITLINIPQIDVNWSVMFPVLAAWVIFLGAFIFFYLLKNSLKLDKGTVICLILVCGLGNTSFVGYPVLKAIYGEEAIRYAILVDQPGTFLALSTVGVMLAMTAGSGSYNIFTIIRRLLFFPPFIAFIAALLLPRPWFSGEWTIALYYIGALMVPLAMLSIGLQFSLSRENINWQHFALGLGYKLVLAPLLIFILLFLWLGKEGLMYEVTVLECAMPPMITASVLAVEYGHNPRLANLLATWGIPLSAITIFFWYQLLQLF
jgi:malate permease and related proteins